MGEFPQRRYDAHEPRRSATDTSAPTSQMIRGRSRFLPSAVTDGRARCGARGTLPPWISWLMRRGVGGGFHRGPRSSLCVQRRPFTAPRLLFSWDWIERHFDASQGNGETHQSLFRFGLCQCRRRGPLLVARERGLDHGQGNVKLKHVSFDRRQCLSWLRCGRTIPFFSQRHRDSSEAYRRLSRQLYHYGT
jgi:hypothetical protein